MNQNDKRFNEFLGDFRLLCKQYEIAVTPVTMKYMFKDHNSADMSCRLHLQHADDSEVVVPEEARREAINS